MHDLCKMKGMYATYYLMLMYLPDKLIMLLITTNGFNMAGVLSTTGYVFKRYYGYVYNTLLYFWVLRNTTRHACMLI